YQPLGCAATPLGASCHDLWTAELPVISSRRIISAPPAHPETSNAISPHDPACTAFLPLLRRSNGETFEHPGPTRWHRRSTRRICARIEISEFRGEGLPHTAPARHAGPRPDLLGQGHSAFPDAISRAPEDSVCGEV